MITRSGPSTSSGQRSTSSGQRSTSSGQRSTSSGQRWTSSGQRGGAASVLAALAALATLLAVAGCHLPPATDAPETGGSAAPSSSASPEPDWPGGDTNSQPTPVDPIEANLSDIKTELMAYHDSGRYERDLEAMATRAQSCMLAARAGVAKPALVLDIDETALSNYTWMVSVDFLRNSPMLSTLFAQHAAEQNTPAIEPTLKLYRAARQAGITVFFISGRSTKLAGVTEANLKKVGYTEFGPSSFTSPDAPPAPSIVPFKSGAREKIEAQGYTVVANVGDQNSDLEGGAGECQHKLPNPYYYIP